MNKSLLKLAFIAVLSVYNTQAAKSCNGTAKYTLTFRGEWTSQRHNDFPSNPHFSPLVGCSHKAAYVMWEPGTKASTGVESVAETGSTTEINREIDIQIAAKNASKRYQGKLIFGGTASDSISDIAVNSEYPLVSFINMIAPSPDWFLGVRDLSLCNTTTGEWQDSVVRDLFPYDSGTDDGTTFVSNPDDQPTIPQQNIHRLTKDIEGSLKGDKPIERFGTFTFVKTSENGVKVTAPTSEMPSTTPTSTSGMPSTTPTSTLEMPSTTPTSTANLGTSYSITAVMILCLMIILL